ncbi:hypothetical protein KDW99_03025 [Marinomonas rhizomae]|uniref:hypothetical protein n=1 Tax=Marinomonas rhizomae TaxID=491948 RepID=UPI00210598A7|nr:hypothetical protein [Marinomonas rhizomae]UTW00133.1 hypothetical protein KDW99_03025 [Marinomonas rhizomae]
MHDLSSEYNDGDWVEHCTALTESAAGEMSLMHWSENPRVLATEPKEEDWGLSPVPARS